MAETTAIGGWNEGIRRGVVAALLLSIAALSAVVLVFATDVSVASLTGTASVTSASKNATDASLTGTASVTSASKNATDASLTPLLSIMTATSGTNTTAISVPPFAITSDGALFGGAYDATALQLNFTCNGTLAAITSSEAFPKPVVEVYVNGSAWESFTANATHIEVASLSGSSSVCIVFTAPPFYTIGPFTLTSDLPFNTTTWAPANGTWNAEAGELIFSPGVADVNISADRFPSTTAWYFIAWWDDPLDLSTVDQPIITRVDSDYDLMQIPMFWHSPSSGAGYCVIVRFITLPLATGPAQMNISEGDASLTSYTDTDGELTLTGCGDIMLSSEGLPSGDFFVIVNGAVYDDWAWNGSYIWLYDVPCPDAVITIDFDLPGEHTHCTTCGGGGGGSLPQGDNDGDGASDNADPDDDNDGLPDAVDPRPFNWDPPTTEPTNETVPPTNQTDTAPTQDDFAAAVDSAFGFIPEEIRPVVVFTIVGLPVIFMLLLIVGGGATAKGAVSRSTSRPSGSRTRRYNR